MKGSVKIELNLVLNELQSKEDERLRKAITELIHERGIDVVIQELEMYSKESTNSEYCNAVLKALKEFRTLGEIWEVLYGNVKSN